MNLFQSGPRGLYKNQEINTRSTWLQVTTLRPGGAGQDKRCVLLTTSNSRTIFRSPSIKLTQYRVPDIAIIPPNFSNFFCRETRKKSISLVKKRKIQFISTKRENKYCCDLTKLYISTLAVVSFRPPSFWRLGGPRPFAWV